MIHYLYIGHFKRDGNVVQFEKRSDGAPSPVVERPLDVTVVRKLLAEKGVAEKSVPEDWWLWITEDGYIVCDRHTRNRDAIDFIRNLARATGCDIVRDGILFVSPDELTFTWDESEREVI